MTKSPRENQDEFSTTPEALAKAFDMQAHGCRDNEHPLYGSLLESLAASMRANGPLARRLADWDGRPVPDALGLRVMGALHDRVLAGALPELARCYESSAPDGEASPETCRVFHDALESEADFVRARCDAQVQTNEVRRAAALLGGFLEIAAGTELPLRLLEMGSSAGLNLCWDRYRYRLGDHERGPADAPLCLETDWVGAAPPDPVWPLVASREGCDLSPIDVRDPAQARKLSSFLWPGQHERLSRLRAACAVAADEGLAIEQSPILPWLEARLAKPVPGVVTVFFHSIVWLYLSNEERAGVTRLLKEAGARASADAPLAWLRMEGIDPNFAELWLQQWPGGEGRPIGRTRYHGQQVHWGPSATA